MVRFSAESEKHMVRLRVLVCSTLVVSLLLLSNGRAQQPPDGKFQARPDGVPDQWIVVLTPQAAGPRGPASRAGAVAADLTRSYGGTVRFVYDWVLNGFSLQAPEGVAVAISLDPRVATVRQDAVAMPL